MLLECCKFGKVRFVQLLEMSEILEARPEVVDWEGRRTLALKKLDGSVVVTFEQREAAESCASALANRWFDGLQLVTSTHLPKVSPATDLPAASLIVKPAL